MTFDRRDFLKAGGVLSVGFSLLGATGLAKASAKTVAKESVDTWLTISADNNVTIYSGKVDLGTCSRASRPQLAADELDVPFERIQMVMGDTATTPDQWLTAASLT